MAVHYESRDRIRIITIDRPEARNAIDIATSQDLLAAWTEFRDDDDAWVAILTGAGDRAFSAGADLKELDPPARSRQSQPRSRGVITRDFTCYKPMIAAINGSAYGGGLEMALACDLRIMSDQAKLALSEARWGLLPGSGGTQRLPRAIPPAVAYEMLFTAEPIDARRAYEVGLVNRVEPADQVLPSAVALAERICRNGPLAVRAAKEAVQRGTDPFLSEALRMEQQLNRIIHGSEDAIEGPAAFREKRAPNFRGV